MEVCEASHDPIWGVPNQAGEDPKMVNPAAEIPMGAWQSPGQTCTLHAEGQRQLAQGSTLEKRTDTVLHPRGADLRPPRRAVSVARRRIGNLPKTL